MLKKDKKSREEIFENTIKTNIERKSSYIDKVYLAG